MPEVLKSKQKPRGAAALGAGPGRPKGLQNSLTKDLKQMIEAALDQVGGKDYLVEQAGANPKAFLSLVGRLLPKDITVTGGIDLKLCDALKDLAEK